MTVQPTTAEVLAGHDVVFLALPHGHSGRVAAELTAAHPDTLVVDLAADHRLVSAESWQAYYASEHQGTWPYGLPEMLIAGGGKQRERLRGAQRIAVPGCNVTAVTLAAAPLLQAGVIRPEALTAVLANGPSGAGRALKSHLLAAEILGSASPYAVGGSHRHIPEIEQNLNQALGADPVTGPVRITFTPTLVPMARGILATVSAPLAPGLDAGQARRKAQQAFTAAYGDEPFVRVLPDGQWPATASTAGSNVAQLQWALDERAGSVVVVIALDNLSRGTAGQAIQSAQIALGLDEGAGLPLEGVAP
ncbi:N-acetyl-gamma-glutamyl-phosphate reductase [Sediminivirga luteola]|uniref:N-acetyl-gamma-glutamyl-phosphate reductase n=2 Tax=Sediminivirga luteola TaxID=1774748 RepID=A0A8J2U0K2_9MICO|nr:N-acetyl-gamma-glutamyl-phosphate reductase [Sediminivirga luteola]